MKQSLMELVIAPQFIRRKANFGMWNTENECCVVRVPRVQYELHIWSVSMSITSIQFILPTVDEIYIEVRHL